MKKILIIGGCGFIGHNLAISLSKKNKVTVIDGLNVNNLLSFQDSNIVNKDLYRKVLNNRLDLLNQLDINLFVQDVRDYHLLSKTIDQVDPEIVVHLAAVSHANISNKTPFATFDHSLRTLENALDCVKHKKVHFIYLSSSMVYGDFDGRVVKEDDKLNPKGIYGSLKLAGELIIKSYSEVFNFDYTIIRPSALYGERCVSRRVTQIFIESALTNRPLVLNGDGSEKLDFTYIQDLIQGIEKVISNKKSRNEIFNITYGQGRALNDVVKILKKNFARIKVNYKNRDSLVPIRGALSIDKAKKLLNYNPTFNLDEGFQKYISWYKDFYKKHNLK